MLPYSQIVLYLIATFPSDNAQTAIQYEYRIKEELPIGTLIGKLKQDIQPKLPGFELSKTQVQYPNYEKEVSFKILNYGDAGVSCFNVSHFLQPLPR